MIHHFLLTADHLAVTAIESPNTAARSHVDVMNTSIAQLASATNVVNVIGVAAVDDYVARTHESEELIDNGVYQRRRDHQPDCARLLELRDEVVERLGADCALVHDRLHRFRAAVVNNTLVAAAQKAPHHVGAHAAEANHSDLHQK